jgi:predicted peroxiredoxin
VDLNIFLIMEGVKPAQRGIEEDLVAMENGQKIIQFIRDAKNAVVKFYVCLPALPGYEINETNLIDEVDETSGGVMLADMIISCDKLLSF